MSSRVAKFVLVFVCLFCSCVCQTLTFGIQAAPSQEYVDQYWYPMLNAAAQGIGRNATVVAVLTDTQGYQLVANGSLDYFYMGGALYDCLQTQYDVSPVVSSIQNVVGVPTSYLGAAIVAREDSGIETLDDVRGTRIALPQLSYLSSCQAQWFQLLLSGIHMFLDTEVVAIVGSPQEVVLAVDAGVVDVGFLTAGDLDKYTNNGLISESDFVYVNEINTSLFPAPVSTTLYPGSLLTALPHTDLEERTALARALMNLTLSQLDANISAWIVGQNYAPVRNLQSQLGVLKLPSLGAIHGYCIQPTAVVSDYVQCQPGYVIDEKVKCLLNGRECTSQYICICNPCVKIPPPRGKLLGTLIPLAFLVCVMSFCLYRCISQRRFENMIHFHELHVSDKSLVIGQSSKGLVLKGEYMGSPVAVKRAKWTPLRSTSTSSPFEVVDSNKDSDHKEWRIIPGLKRLYGGKINQGAIRRASQTSRIQHPNIIHFLGASEGPSVNDVLLVSPFMKHGTLYDSIQNRTFFMDTEIVAAVIRDVCEGLSFLHNINMFGADVRSHHLYFDDHWRVRISRTHAATSAASKICQAPEVLAGNAHTHTSDVYAIGMLMYELLYRKTPYEDHQIADIMTSWRPPTLDLSRQHEHMHEIMQSCWSAKPEDRPTVGSLIRMVSNQGSVADALFVETNRAKALLKTALPVRVAVSLREGKRIEPHQKHVSLCLLEILDADRQAIRVSRIFKALEALCVANSLFHVETIDRCFLVSGNLHVNQANHASRVWHFAQNALDDISKTEDRTSSSKSQKVFARCGIHCGLVTASIMGYDHPRYVINGACLTVLSRMATTSEPGHVQLSSDAYEAVAENEDSTDKLSRREGRISVRGQGHLVTYWSNPQKLSSNSNRIRTSFEFKLPVSASASEQRCSTIHESQTG